MDSFSHSPCSTSRMDTPGLMGTEQQEPSGRLMLQCLTTRSIKDMEFRDVSPCVEGGGMNGGVNMPAVTEETQTRWFCCSVVRARGAPGHPRDKMDHSQPRRESFTWQYDRGHLTESEHKTFIFNFSFNLTEKLVLWA